MLGMFRLRPYIDLAARLAGAAARRACGDRRRSISNASTKCSAMPCWRACAKPMRSPCATGTAATPWHRHGIAAALMPDPAVLVAELFGNTHRRTREPQRTRGIARGAPTGYLAVQCSAVFRRRRHARCARRAADPQCARRPGHRAAARRRRAWHDDLGVLRGSRSAPRRHDARRRIARSVGCVRCSPAAPVVIASSLHGRIVSACAAAHRPSTRRGQQRILPSSMPGVQTCQEPERAGSVVMPAALADALATALREPRCARRTASTRRRLPCQRLCR